MSLVPMYYRGAAIQVFVFDLSEATSLQAVEVYVKEIQNKNLDACLYLLVGCKADLPRKITNQQIEKFVQQYPFLLYNSYEINNFDQASVQMFKKDLHFLLADAYKYAKQNIKLVKKEKQKDGHTAFQCTVQ